MNGRALRRTLALAAALLALVVAGVSCGDDETTTPTPTPAVTATTAPTSTPTPDPGVIEVTWSGVVKFDTPIGTLVQWAAGVRNSSDGDRAIGFGLTALVYDDAGILLASDDRFVPVLFPGQEVVVGWDFIEGVRGEPSRIEVRLREGTLEPAMLTGVLATADVRLDSAGSRSRVVGLVTNPYPHDLVNVRISCAVLDESGRLLGFGLSYLTLLPTGATGEAACDLSPGLHLDGAREVTLTASVGSMSDMR